MPFYNYGNEMLALDLLGTIYLLHEYNLNTYTPTPPHHHHNHHRQETEIIKIIPIPRFLPLLLAFHLLYMSTVQYASLNAGVIFFINNSSIIDVHITVQ